MRSHEFIALRSTERAEKERAEHCCPARSYTHLRRRSGRSPALPYPPRRHTDSITRVKNESSFYSNLNYVSRTFLREATGVVSRTFLREATGYLAERNSLMTFL